jgi:carbamate kinase
MVIKRKQKEILLVALGGNALIQKGQLGTAEEQTGKLDRLVRYLCGIGSA